MAKLIINKELSYKPAEGEYVGWLHLVDYDPKTRYLAECTNEIRLTFYLKTGDPLIQYVVARNFCLDCDETDDLQRFVQNWLGDEFVQYIDADGAVDLERLVGRLGLITVVLRPTPGKTIALRKITRIAPVVEEEEKAA